MCGLAFCTQKIIFKENIDIFVFNVSYNIQFYILHLKINFLSNYTQI